MQFSDVHRLLRWRREPLLVGHLAPVGRVNVREYVLDSDALRTGRHFGEPRGTHARRAERAGRADARLRRPAEDTSTTRHRYAL